MNKTFIFIAALLLNACTWEFGRDEQGHTQVRQKYPMGSGVYHSDGAASQNTHYHHMRLKQHVIVPSKTE